jgi:PQQ-dependent dehydrogenase (methanol/ethanol family)
MSRTLRRETGVCSQRVEYSEKMTHRERCRGGARDPAARVTRLSTKPKRGSFEKLLTITSYEVCARSLHARRFFSTAALAFLSLALARDANAQSNARPSSPTTAQAQFQRTCALCHGGNGEGTDRAPAVANSTKLRGSTESELADVIKNGRGGMPAFPLPPAELDAMVHYIRSLNVAAFEMHPEGDVAAGRSIFFGSGGCGGCHTALGRGGANGPDLSNIGRQLTVRELTQWLEQPGAQSVPGYQIVKVQLRNGDLLRGFARSRGTHNLQLQTLDGRFHLLDDDEYSAVSEETSSFMPPFLGTPEEHRDLIAFLSAMGGVAVGPAPGEQETVSQETIRAILNPAPGDWPTYAGKINGNRYSALSEINTGNVDRLRLAWTSSIPYFGLETTPLVMDGVMYVTGPNQVSALDGRTGREIWHYSRPRTPGGIIAGDAAKGANRGVAMLGDRVFFITDNAHLICLHRLTGALLWDIVMPDQEEHYGGTSAPLVVGDTVVAGVAGGDEGIRGFVAAYKATTGERIWRFWTVPRPGESGSETWKGKEDELGGGSTWLSGSYDAESGVLYWPTGNPYPDTDGDKRGGDNLYTDCDLALDAKTGKLLWYFQYTPHDLHDWDASQPIVLVDVPFHGSPRKLLLHANRNGFFYVLNRTSGELLQATPLAKRITWASGIDKNGRPKLLPANETNEVGVKTCPAVRGATNWYSTAYNPVTNLYYVMTVEDCTVYHKAQNGGYARVNDPAEPAMKYLRAIEIETGKIAWELPLIGPVESNYSGVLSTVGGLVFFGETSGGFAAVDAMTGKYLWHFEANQPWKASPMTYQVDGRQYVAIASGANILSFALPDR